MVTFFSEITSLVVFSLRFIRESFKPPYEFNETLKQSYLIGYKSLPLIAITTFIVGLVFTLQTQPTLILFNAERLLPAMVSVSIFREVGPVIVALICAGKVGSGIGAEIASMRITEQIDAMEVSAVNPFKYVVVTRVWASMLTLPLLVVLGDAFAIVGAYVGINLHSRITATLFFFQVFERLLYIDVVPALIKTVFFGFTIGIVSCYKGYTASDGTQGVGRAANASVVSASLLVILVDMLTVQVAGLFME